MYLKMLAKFSSRNLQIPVLQYMMPCLGISHVSTKTLKLKFWTTNWYARLLWLEIWALLTFIAA